MKRFFLLILLGILFFSRSDAQTLHSIIFANTECPGNEPGSVGIGPSVTVDYERMSIEMSSISSFIGYKLQRYYYTGSSDVFNRPNLERVLRDLKCGPEDIVFFYYSGHGGRFLNEESPYPEMILDATNGPAERKNLYPLWDVYNNLMAKRPRLTVVMGDLCNSVWNVTKSATPNREASYSTNEIKDVYRNLFLNVKGGLIVTSSKPGQVSACAQFPDGSDAGGMFTNTFLHVLGTYVRHGNLVNWETLLSQSRDLCKEVSGNGQTPYFSTQDLVTAVAPTPSGNETPAPAPSADNVQMISIEEIAATMTAVGNGLYRAADRIRCIPNASKAFAANARIEVVGKDSRTVVNTSTPSRYLNYLSVATNIEQIVVLDQKRDSQGKISYLKVHEIRKK